MEFNFKFNADQNQMEAQIRAEVISLGDKKQVNKNGTEYVVGAIRFTNAQGKIVERSAIAYMKNVEKGITVGETYLCNITVTADRPSEPIISISPLTSAERATADDFNFDFTVALAAAGVGVEEVA